MAIAQPGASHAVGAAPASGHRRTTASPVDYPQHAKPGQCFQRVRVDAVFATTSHRVMVSPPRRERHVIEAVYAAAERQVLVAPARIERREIPATFKTITETVVVSPARVRVEQVPPIYGLDFEQVMVRPAYQEWRRVSAPAGETPPGARRDADGEIICLVDVPAQYATREHRVVRVPGRTSEVRTPAVTRTVTRQVIDQPARVETTEVPAQFTTERYQRLVTPRHVEVTLVPAGYAVQDVKREIAPAHDDWREIKCAPDAAAASRPPQQAPTTP